MLEKMECGVNYTTQVLKDNVNGLIDLSLRPTNVGLVRDGNIVYIGYKLNSSTDLYWAFTSSGVNGLYSINYGYKLLNTGDLPKLDHNFSSEVKYFGDIDTDWIGPYIVKRQSESSASLFTGGHHAKDGTTNLLGTPSATSSGYTLFADGVEIFGDFSGIISSVKILTSNLVQSGAIGSNFEPILRQDVEMNITDTGVSVDIKTTALDAIRVDRFYGFQTYAFINFSEIRFFGDTTISGLALPNDTTTPLSTAEVRSVGHIDLNGDVLCSFVNDGQLGNFRLKGAANSYASRSNRKTYFNIINSFNDMSVGDSFSVSGGWSYTRAITKLGGIPTVKCAAILPTKYGCDIVFDYYGSTGNKAMRLVTPKSINGALEVSSQMSVGGVNNDKYIQSYIESSSTGSSANGILIARYKK